ncbi:hypothetical protein ES703_83110 [subsurface metagenome]
MGNDSLGDIHLPVKIDADIEVPVSYRHLHKRFFATAGAGVVNQDIYPAEFLDNSPHHGIHLGTVGHIHLHRHRLTSHLFDFRRRLFSPFQIKVGGDNVAAFLRQRHGYSFPVSNLAAGSGYQRHLAF